MVVFANLFSSTLTVVAGLAVVQAVPVQGVVVFDSLACISKSYDNILGTFFAIYVKNFINFISTLFRIRC